MDGNLKPKCYAERLAPEILSIIFHDVMALHELKSVIVIPADGGWQENEVDTRPLLSLSHVCKYWRDIALGNPSLWRRIHGQCREQMEVFLERSQPLTTTLFLDARYWGGQSRGPLTSSSVVKTHAARLCRLDLSMVPTWDHIVPLLKSLHAPHLKCLTVTSPYVCNSLEGTRTSWAPFLNKDTSSLRAFAIMPVTNWLPSCGFPHLTHLLISFDRETALYYPSDVLRLLSNTPAIIFLHVNFLLQHRGHLGDWQTPPDSISLRHLRSLVFTSCSYELMHAVISRLSFPEDVFIRLQDILNSNGFDDHPHPFSPLSLHPVTSLDLCIRNDAVLMVADGSTSGLWFDGHHDLVEDPVPWVTWLLHLHEMLPLSYVTHLHISVDGDPAFWPEFLTRLPQVSHLTALIREPRESDRRSPDGAEPVSSTGILCRALSPSPDTPVRCPLLRTLAIEWQGTLTIEIAAALPRIPAMLRARARAGHPVHRLVVEAEPHPLLPYPGAVTALELFQDFEELFVPDGIECEVVRREQGAQGPSLCAFRMRDVWSVDGEEQYWEVDSYDKPRYSVSGVWF